MPAADFRKASLADVFDQLASSKDGLSSEDARARLKRYGPNSVREHGHAAIEIFFRQLKNPLLGLLVAATFVSLTVGQRTDAVIILAIISLSVSLGFFDEYRADRAARLLQSRLTRSARVLRDGSASRIDVDGIVPGDIAMIEVGDIVGADLRLIDATELTADEAALTGESLPVDKHAAEGTTEDEDASVLAGTIVRSGRGRGVVIATGGNTEFGGIAAGVSAPPPMTEFEQGLRRFSYFLVAVTAVLTTFIFAANAILGRGFLESLLFSLAIAVGLTPQLLPAIITVSLAMGGRRLAAQKVIVRHLVAIEDLGNVEVLFSDKTGTLTSGTITLEQIVAAPPEGCQENLLALVSMWSVDGHAATSNQLDAALGSDPRVQAAQAGRDGWTVAGELPFSYERRAGALVLSEPGGKRNVVVKGAAEEVLAHCTTGTTWGEDWHAKATSSLEQLMQSGSRVLAVATHPDDGSDLEKQASEGLDFTGFLGFSDPPKEEARPALAKLAELGIELKILTGDHPAVAQHVCERLGIEVAGMTTGADLEGLSEQQLTDVVQRTTVFARVSPEQKRSLIRAVQRTGRDVGFLGDGVNDAPGLRQADIGISVDDATDVAKAAADVVLLEKDLGVLAAGVLEGRRTFANTVKYVLMATSSNFGNMFSAAGASLFLDFLPMLPTQILLNNFLYDVSELTLPTDRVDPELTHRPAHWDISVIGRFMVVFGPASSIYDFLTFFLMIEVFHADESLFQSGWFVESLCTQTLVIFVLRTRYVPFWRSRPSRPLLWTTLACVAIAVALPYSPLASPFGFTALPWGFIGALVAMVITYLSLVEITKRWFFRHWGFGSS